MTVEEIYSKIAAHMVKGLMIHSQLADYYYFLNLPGYGCCHEYHFLKENEYYRSFVRGFIKAHNRLIPEIPISNPKVIPSTWYKYRMTDLDAGVIKSAVKDGLEMWVKWETETKELYEDMYKELLDIGSISDTITLEGMICDVSKELETAIRYSINKELINYDVTTIISEQGQKYDKYKEKIKCMW